MPEVARASLGDSGVNVPANIGQYRIVRQIGAGGMGAVYLGEHVLLGRRAAIKTLLPSLAIHQEIVDRFFNEARATSGIVDPGVVQVFDFGYHVDGIAFIVMELLEGESLAGRLHRLGRLPCLDALRIARQIAFSLGTAHAGGIVHRDLKPENVFLIHDAVAQGGERTKLLDFGICKVDDANDGVHTQTGMTLGTPAYMSPEQCRGIGGVDHRSDIYALGCVLFHMLTGHPPFELEGAGELIVAHLQEAPPAPSSCVPGLPASVDALIARCLAKAPDDRFASTGELIDAIDASDAASVVDQPRPARSTPPPPRVLARAKRTVPAKRAASSGEPMPTTLGSANGQAEGSEGPPVRSSVRGTIAIVLIAGVVTALAATRFRGGSDEVIADPAIAAPVEPAAQPAPATTVALTLDAAAPVVDAMVTEPEPEPVADAISAVGAPVATAEVAKPSPTSAPPEDLDDPR